MDIYATKGTFLALQLSGHRCKRIRTGNQFRLGDFDIMPFKTVHDAAEPVGFLIANSNGEKLLFLTDTAYCEYKFKGLTQIMIECNFSNDIINEQDMPTGQKQRLLNSHMSLERVLDFFDASDTSKLEEVHLIHLSDGNSDEKLFKRKVQEVVGVPVYVCGA